MTAPSHLTDGPMQGKVAGVKDLRQIVRKVLALCATVFIADVVAGIIFPTFSLYARSLGASLTLIGALSGVAGLTSIVASVPIGLLSDARGRRTVVSAGMLLLSASSFLYTVTANPYFLIPVRMLGGLAGVATFFIGIAYLGDLVARHERPLAVGLYTTSMGLGFTVGPAIGGFVAATYGYRASYRLAALVALIGFVVARRGLVPRSTGGGTVSHSTSVPLGRKLRVILHEPNLLAASLATLINSVVFSSVLGFFPLYAASLSVGEATIGSMFAFRALISTLARFPTGLLATRVPTRNLMVMALGLSMTIVVSIAHTTMPVALGILLAGEGIAYGMFMTSGQAYVTEHASEANRGTAIGVYSTAGSVGSTVGPFLLGLIAEVWGLAAVFQVTGGLVFLGIGGLWYLRSRQG